MRILLFVALLATSQACWFQGRAKSVGVLLNYATKEGVDIDVGINKKALESILKKLPGSVSWVVKKAGGASAIMNRCDLNGDGFIRANELREESECLNSCWKQIAISTLL